MNTEQATDLELMAYREWVAELVKARRVPAVIGDMILDTVETEIRDRAERRRVWS